MTVKIEVTNEGKLTIPWLRVLDPIPFDLGAGATRWVTTLRPGERRSTERVIEANRRGYHTIGPAMLATGDWFGLRTEVVTGVPSTGLLVYPRIVPLHGRQLDASSPMAVIRSRQALHEDATRLVGVRDYRSGDPTKRIHWTASAAHGDLLVKQFEHAVDRQVVVAVDLTASAHPHPGRRRSAELAVTVAASLIHHLVTEERHQVGLRLVGQDAPTGRPLVADTVPRSDDVHLMEMLGQLARVRISRGARPELLTSPRGLGFGIVIVLVAGLLDRATAISLVRLRRLGAVPSVVLTGQREDDQLGILEGIPVSRVGSLSEVASL